jgi:hypothetical protein
MDRSLYHASTLLYITMLPTAPSLLASTFVLYLSLPLSLSLSGGIEPFGDAKLNLVLYRII